MKQRRIIGCAVGLCAILLIFGGGSRADDSQSETPMMRNRHAQGPYGGYCRGPQWGWYGAQRRIRTEEDARAYLEKFFEGQDLAIGPITERGRFFNADILDKDKKIVDRVILDRRSGRIRSLY